MHRKQIAIVSLALAVAAVIGTVALTRTIGLGQASARAPSSVIAKRKAQLNRFEASLRAQLERTPPPVPALPKLPAAPAASAPATPQAQRVVYVRPAPIVIHKHRAGGEHESDDGSEGGGDD